MTQEISDVNKLVQDGVNSNTRTDVYSKSNYLETEICFLGDTPRVKVRATTQWLA